MIFRRHCNAFLLVISVVVAGLITGCTPGEPIAGGSGSTTTNGFTATIVNGQGNPVCNAPVRIRPGNYCAADNGLAAPVVTGTVADTFTGDDGTIVRGNMEPGLYTIEVFDENTGMGAVVRSEITAGPVREFGEITVEPVGAISGGLDVALLNDSLSFGIQVYGMERITSVDVVTGTFIIDGLPPTEYILRLVSTDTGFQPVDLDTVAVVSHNTANVNPYAVWKHAATLSINSAAAGLSATDTLFNFPLLLRLDLNNFDFSTAKKKGEDFRVTKGDGSAVPFEHEWWDSTNAVAALWILVDTLYGSLPVQTLNLYWGNRGGLSVSRPSEVFDTVAGFGGVWHLNESGGTAQKDATVNKRDGAPLRMDGSNDVPGIIGRAQQFKNDSQCIIFQTAGGASDGSDSAWAVSLWVKASKVDTAANTIITHEDLHYSIHLDTASRWFFYEATDESGADSCCAPAFAETWVHLCGIRRGIRNYLYVNGTIADSCVTDATAPSVSVREGTFRLGSSSHDTEWFLGTIDELRIYQCAISDAWVRMCYETQRENQQVIVIEKVDLNQ